MPEPTLQAISALNGLSLTQGNTRISEAPNLSIVSVSVPLGGRTQLDERLKQSIGSGLPAVGKITHTNNGHTLLGLQADQCFLVSHEHWADPVAHVASMLSDCAYLTDQSDSWAVLDIEGPLCRSALERICPVDIAETVFDLSCVARTAMEHLSVIVEQRHAEKFRLYSPRSSAQSFAHIICTSLAYVADSSQTTDC